MPMLWDIGSFVKSSPYLVDDRSIEPQSHGQKVPLFFPGVSRTFTTITSYTELLKFDSISERIKDKPSWLSTITAKTIFMCVLMMMMMMINALLFLEESSFLHAKHPFVPILILQKQNLGANIIVFLENIFLWRISKLNNC